VSINVGVNQLVTTGDQPMQFGGGFRHARDRRRADWTEASG